MKKLFFIAGMFLFPLHASALTYEEKVFWLIDEMPHCAENVREIRIANSLPGISLGTIGSYDYERERLWIKRGLSEENLLHAVSHECGHVAYFSTANALQRSFFGKPRYVSDYAAINKREDFAESYSHYMTDRLGFWQKAKDSRTLRAKYLSIDQLVR